MAFKNSSLLTAHRIVNITWMQIAAERAQRQLKVNTAIFDPAYMSRGIVNQLGFGPLGHAEEIESSHMMHAYPQMVRIERALDYPAPHTALYSPDPRYPADTLCYQPTTKEKMLASVDAAKGATGCPSRSSAEKGRVYHEHLIGRLVQVIQEL